MPPYFCKLTLLINSYGCFDPLTYRCNLFTFLTVSTLLHKSVRGAFRNVGRKLREIHISDSETVVNRLVPCLFACFSCLTLYCKYSYKSADNSIKWQNFLLCRQNLMPMQHNSTKNFFRVLFFVLLQGNMLFT